MSWLWSLRRRPRRLDLLRRAGLGLLVAAALLVGVEGLLRLGHQPPAYAPERMAGWRMTASLDQARMRGSHQPHDFLLSTNADGLRSGLSRSRGPLPRVALMGDSTVFGWGVEDHESLPACLEEAWGGRVEVLNAAQPGYSTTQAAWLLREVVDAYAPDGVVLFLSQHDQNRVLVSDAEALRGGRGPRAALRVALARHSRLYQVLRGALDPLADQDQLLPGQPGAEGRVPRVSPDERAEALADMRALLEARGAWLALGVLPSHADLQRPTGAAPLPREGLEDLRIDVDLRSCCGPDPEPLVLPIDPNHYSAEGNRRIAVGLAEALRGRVR